VVGDLVVASSGRIGVNQLTVGGHHDAQQAKYGEGDIRREVEVGQATQGEDDEDLLSGVRDRRQGVAGEDGQRDPLGQQRLVEALAAQRPTDEQAL
jgi:hypothetical protein